MGLRKKNSLKPQRKRRKTLPLSFNPPKKIYLAPSNIPKAGKGVFATREIKKDEIVEVAPVLVLEFTDFVDTKWNLLFPYLLVKKS